jgi:hypothetical protein
MTATAAPWSNEVAAHHLFQCVCYAFSQTRTFCVSSNGQLGFHEFLP